MKAILTIRAASGEMKRFLALGAVLILATATQTARAASAAEWLEKGIYTEETKGELETACAIYRQIVDEPGADRSLVAQAQLRLGLCELKLGNKPQAISALERLTQEFPDKDTLLTLIGQHMPEHRPIHRHSPRRQCVGGQPAGPGQHLHHYDPGRAACRRTQGGGCLDLS